MKNILLFVLFLSFYNCKPQEKNNYKFLADKICSCIHEQNKELTIEIYQKCVEKVGAKHKKLLNNLEISKKEEATNPLQKQWAVLNVGNDLANTLFKECKTVEEFTIKFQYNSLRNRFLDIAALNICNEINSDKTKYHNYWEANDFITEYYIKNKEVVIEFVRYYFYDKENTDSNISLFYRELSVDLRKRLRSECNYFSELEQKIN